jgi:hypothetical protein
MKVIYFFSFIFIFSTIFANSHIQNNNNEKFFKSLFFEAETAMKYAKKICSTLPQQNEIILNSMNNLYKKAQKKGLNSTKTFYEATTLLSILKKQILKTCNRVNLANEDALKTIIISESNTLVLAKQKSNSVDEFLKNSFDTEYARFLFLMTMPKTFSQMINNWGKTMSKTRKNPKKIIINIKNADKTLAINLRKAMEMIAKYYEQQKVNKN